MTTANTYSTLYRASTPSIMFFTSYQVFVSFFNSDRLLEVDLINPSRCSGGHGILMYGVVRKSGNRFGPDGMLSSVINVFCPKKRRSV